MAGGGNKKAASKKQPAIVCIQLVKPQEFSNGTKGLGWEKVRTVGAS